MEEKLKAIANNPDYLASTNGEIFSLKNKIFLKKQIGTNGYFCVNLSDSGIQTKVMIHRIIAETFIPNPENKEQVNHIDGNKLNNHVSNLEWTTRSENIKHSYEKLNRKTPKHVVEQCSTLKSRKIKITVLNSGKTFEFSSASKAAKHFKKPRTYFSNLINNKDGEDENYLAEWMEV